MIKNRSGSILQIVLIIFLILTFNIMTIYNNIIENSRGIKRIEEINTSRLIELSLIGYYKHEIESGSLSNNSITIDDYTINYTVADRGSDLEIITSIKYKEIAYQFIITIKRDSINVIKFEYQ